MKLGFEIEGDQGGLELMRDMHAYFPLVQKAGEIARKDATAQAISLNRFVKGSIGVPS